MERSWAGLRVKVERISIHLLCITVISRRLLIELGNATSLDFQKWISFFNFLPKSFPCCLLEWACLEINWAIFNFLCCLSVVIFNNGDVECFGKMRGFPCSQYFPVCFSEASFYTLRTEILNKQVGPSFSQCLQKLPKWISSHVVVSFVRSGFLALDLMWYIGTQCWTEVLSLAGYHAVLYIVLLKRNFLKSNFHELLCNILVPISSPVCTIVVSVFFIIFTS